MIFNRSLSLSLSLLWEMKLDALENEEEEKKEKFSSRQCTRSTIERIVSVDDDTETRNEREKKNEEIFHARDTQLPLFVRD